MGLQSYLNAGAVLTPGILATICSVTVTGPGLYEVNVVSYQSGTPDGKDTNAQIINSGGVVGTILMGPIVAPTRCRVMCSSGDTIIIQSVIAATAGAVYNASLEAHRISTSVDQ